MTILSRVLCWVARPSAKQQLSDLQWEVDRLNEFNAKLAADLAKVTQERDILIKSQRYLKHPNEIEGVLTVDEAFTKCRALINAAGVVMVEAVDHFHQQMEVITDVEGYHPRELTMAQDKVVKHFDAFLDTIFVMFDDRGTLGNIHLNARTAERIASALRDGEYHAKRRGNHLKLIK